MQIHVKINPQRIVIEQVRKTTLFFRLFFNHSFPRLSIFFFLCSEKSVFVGVVNENESPRLEKILETFIQ